MTNPFHTLLFDFSKVCVAYIFNLFISLLSLICLYSCFSWTLFIYTLSLFISCYLFIYLLYKVGRVYQTLTRVREFPTKIGIDVEMFTCIQTGEITSSLVDKLIRQDEAG